MLFFRCYMLFWYEEARRLFTVQLIVLQCRMMRLKLKLLPLLSEPSHIEVCALLSSACSLEFPHTQCVVYRLRVYSAVSYVIQWPSCFTGNLNRSVYNKLCVVWTPLSGYVLTYWWTEQNKGIFNIAFYNFKHLQKHFLSSKVSAECVLNAHC